MKPLLVSSGEPAGVGPDLCLTLAGSKFPIVVLGDKSILMARAKLLKQPIIFEDYQFGISPTHLPHHLTVLSTPCNADVVPGLLNVKNAAYVLNMLSMATDACLSGEFSALITAPVHKAIINQAGIAFTGHTEFLADRCQSSQVVMMLSCETMNVALVTTHIPLQQVSETITQSLIHNVVTQLYTSLQLDFGINNPTIYVAGLNPHAGEMGYLGREELDVIEPALALLKDQGIDVHGPMPADTMFTPSNVKRCNAFVAMYHDQGLPVLKYAGFGRAVNVTLGLPIIRTSVDHGTALELAGKGVVDAGSLQAAVNMAASMVKKRENFL
jgi:4-hydroxythreonine-4-phosphate dehydrogenase